MGGNAFVNGKNIKINVENHKLHEQHTESTRSNQKYTDIKTRINFKKKNAYNRPLKSCYKRFLFV